MVWVWNTIEGHRFLPAALPIFDRQEKKFTRRTGPARQSIFTISGDGTIRTDRQVYVAPNDMVGEVGAWVPEKGLIVECLDRGKDAVLVQGHLGLVVHVSR